MNYYNEWDSKAADGLRELIKQGLIPDGIVDNRSITDVTANDLMGFRQCHFFAGIGGWSEALRIAGIDKNEPLWTGSCPCQSFSIAGKQKGFDDERDLWPVFFSLIRQCKPERVFGEQVENAIKHGWLDRVYSDLESENYAVGACVLGAHSVGAPHQRQRLYWGAERVSDSHGQRCQRKPVPAERKDKVHEAAGDSSSVRIPDTADNGRDECNQGAGGTFGISEQGRLLESEGTCNCNRMAYSISNALGSPQGQRDKERTDGQLDDRDGFRDDDRNCGTTSNNAMDDCISEGLERHTGNGDDRDESGRDNKNEIGPASEASNTMYLSSLYPWSKYALILCRDTDKDGNHKVRRVPAESVLFGMVDGVSEGMDECSVSSLQAAGGFPLCQPQEFAKGEIATLLKQYGNAIVPQVAAEFIRAFNKKRN